MYIVQIGSKINMNGEQKRKNGLELKYLFIRRWWRCYSECKIKNKQKR